jgi:5-methylcytosine-specific restriction endonuclease McrA
MPFRDPARRRAYQREWVSRNAERHRAQSREGVKRWRARHPDTHRAARRRYYAANAERLNAMVKRWHLAHPEVRAAVRQRRRTRAASGGGFTGAQWRELLRACGGRCGYCGLERQLEPDHRIPLARDGSNAIGNIIPACGPCNRAKGRMTEAEFRERRALEGR